MSQTITRCQFRAAIERGIAACDALPYSLISDLRRVGREAQTVGLNFDSGPGCPLTQAGGYFPEDPGDEADTYSTFWATYDQVIVRDLGVTEPVPTITVEGPVVYQLPAYVVRHVVREVNAASGELFDTRDMLHLYDLLQPGQATQMGPTIGPATPERPGCPGEILRGPGKAPAYWGYLFDTKIAHYLPGGYSSSALIELT